MQEKIKHLLTRTLIAKAFAKKAPILGAIIASEDVLKKLQAASSDLLTGHPDGAINEFQQAVTHAVGAGVNFLGGVSVVGMSAGIIAQTMAQRHADQIAAQKPPHPRDADEGWYSAVVQKAKRATETAKVVKTVLEAAADVGAVGKPAVVSAAVAGLAAGSDVARKASTSFVNAASRVGGLASKAAQRNFDHAQRVAEAGKEAAAAVNKTANAAASKVVKRAKATLKPSTAKEAETLAPAASSVKKSAAKTAPQPKAEAATKAASKTAPKTTPKTTPKTATRAAAKAAPKVASKAVKPDATASAVAAPAVSKARRKQASPPVAIAGESAVKPSKATAKPAKSIETQGRVVASKKADPAPRQRRKAVES